MKQGIRVVPERPEMNEASFPVGSHCKGLQCGRLGSIPGLGRSPGEGNSYALQYSGLENSMDREAWQVTVHGVTKSQTGLSNFHFQLHDCPSFLV